MAAGSPAHTETSPHAVCRHSGEQAPRLWYSSLMPGKKKKLILTSSQCPKNNSFFTLAYSLTHWGRVTHICVGKLTILGSDNGLSPGRRQAIIWTNAWILLIGTLGINFSEILVGIQTFSFKEMRLKMLSAKWRPCCLGLNVLRAWRVLLGGDPMKIRKFSIYMIILMVTSQIYQLYYPYCWCCGSLCRQVISSNGINYLR